MHDNYSIEQRGQIRDQRGKHDESCCHTDSSTRPCWQVPFLQIIHFQGIKGNGGKPTIRKKEMTKHLERSKKPDVDKIVNESFRLPNPLEK